MKIGTYYYPEQWPRQQWARDFDNIAAMGLQIVHMAEFAWFELEPSPGDIRLDWLAECVNMAKQRGMQVILCTPTAAPPIWLVQQHPEVLPIDDAGRRVRFGGRRHYSPTSHAMLDATRRIVSAMVERFADEPAIIGWQIDNEYGGPGFFDQNDHSHAAFRDWLNAKYGSIAKLNEAWGNQFWNTYYTDFDQILLPPRRDAGYANPHIVLDAARFQSWAYAQFNKAQADILRARINKAGTRQWVTHNFQVLLGNTDVNPADFASDFDLVTWDSYPVSGFERNPTGEAFRLGDPDGIGFCHDLYASYLGRWALMEIQLGQVNWSATPNLLYPGAVRLWIWSAFAHGAEFVTTYRYRQPRFGIELFHHGLVEPDGVTPSPGGEQFAKAIEEVKLLGSTPAAKAHPKSATKAGARNCVGLMFDFDQVWWYSILPQSKRWDYLKFIQQWYGAITRLGVPVRVIQPGQPIPADLPLLIATGLQMVDESLVKRLDDYATAGGHLVLTCRTALMDRSGQLWEGKYAAPIVPLIGGEIEGYDGLPLENWGELEMDGQKYKWGAWGDLLYTEENTKIIAKYADQFYAGAAAVTQNKRGNGTVTYCGVAAEDPFIDTLVARLVTPPVEAAPAKRRRKKDESAAPPSLLPVLALPPRTQLLERDGFRVFLNYNDTTVEAPAPEGTEFIVGQRTVEPAGVAVWRI